jgi:hypothetical protein
LRFSLLSGLKKTRFAQTVFKSIFSNRFNAQRERMGIKRKTNVFLKPIINLPSFLKIGGNRARGKRRLRLSERSEFPQHPSILKK